MSEYALIEDGYTITTRVAVRPGIHPEVKFTYRPALASERFEFLRRTDLTGEEKLDHCARILQQHLQTWNVRTKAGAQVETTIQNVRRLQPTLLESLLDIVLGYKPGEQEADQKNSLPG